jgi:hypothetical protein
MLRYTYVNRAIRSFAVRDGVTVNPLSYSLLANAQDARCVSNRYPFVSHVMAHVMRSTLAGRAGVLEEETPDIYATPQDVVMVVRGHADDVMPIPGRWWNGYAGC